MCSLSINCNIETPLLCVNLLLLLLLLLYKSYLSHIVLLLLLLVAIIDIILMLCGDRLQIVLKCIVFRCPARPIG